MNVPGNALSHLSRIRVSQRNPHLLETDNGAPFLMLGDTAWELFHRLTLEEIDFYFWTRAQQGFNIIWANILPEFDGLRVPNRYGHTPLLDLNPATPNEDYFRFVDSVLALAQKHRLYLGLLPTWGDKLTAPWGAGPRIFSLDKVDTARGYAAWLGARFSQVTNILWVLGGDRPPRLFGEDDQFPMRNGLEAELPRTSDWTPIWRAMAEGLRGGGADQLVTYHPQGGPHSTSEFLHNEKWLDLNALQSGHGGGHDVPVWETIARDYQLEPTKPTFDAEPNYEDHPVNPWPVWDPANGFFDGLDVRKQIYRSIFAGGCGVVYGHHCVWQFASNLYEPILEVRFGWKEALDRPGARSVAHLKMLLSQVDFLGMAPDQSRILGDPGVGSAHVRSIGSLDQTLVYVPDGRPIELDLRWAQSRQVVLQEFDPQTGRLFQAGPAGHLGESVVCNKILASADRVIIATVATAPPVASSGTS